MPFKRAVVLLCTTTAPMARWIWFQCPLSGQLCCCQKERERQEDEDAVSMPFKRAVVLLFAELEHIRLQLDEFQCPLSGQLCCCAKGFENCVWVEEFQCPLSGQLCCCGTGLELTPDVPSFNAL